MLGLARSSKHRPRRARVSALKCLALALAASSGLPAQAEEIVVSGKALSREEAEAKAASYLQAVGMTSSVRPAARWIDRVCPKVTGIGDAKISARVEARIRAIANDAGARLAQPGCKGNLVVAFTADGGDLARRIGAANPRLMGQVSPEWRGNLVGGDEPIRWWYSSEVRNGDGKAATTATLPWLSVPMDGGNNAVTANVDTGNASGGGYNLGTGASLISTNAKRAITGATVLVDVTRAEGKDLDAIADYAALVGLAEIRFVPSPPPETILALFQPDSRATALTAQDQAMLRSLYRLPLDRHGRYHRGWLVRDVSGAIATGN